MRFKKSNANLPEIDMTPMIDVTFQLITFFMVITNFENTRADERVKLPRDPLALELKAPREDELVLNIGYFRDSVGNKTDPQAYLFYGDGQQYAVTDEVMLPILNREAQYFKDLGKKVDDSTVEIRADAETPTGLVQNIIKLSQEAGFSKFALKATKEAL